ncbi:MAG: tetratricopeptide repeat protein [Chthoniobacteraceae bacterium]
MSDHPNFTFVFTDIEGSSRLWEESPELMAQALARHDTLLHDIFSTLGGDVFKTMGDSVLVAFDDSAPALHGAIQAQRALAAEDWETSRPLRVRMALHRGPAEQRNDDYFGPTLNRTSRLLSAGHGGQTLLSRAAREDLALPQGITLRDLGERRLRDLSRPERIFQLIAPGLPDEFPPLRSLEVLPNNLPLQLTTFVGRERELADVKRLVESSRLVTLTGPGGTGKTRLSLEVAAGLLATFADGVWLVELATIADPALVAVTTAAALGVREDPERAIEESLIDFLRTKKLLLLLDNCEHLVAACAQLAGRLLRGGPGLRILASSREALAISGETTYAVPTLSLPDLFSTRSANPILASTAGEFEAVRLFVERAAVVQPAFALTDENAATIAKICFRLDGIPLAIELAAARVKMLAPDQILRRLDDRFHLLTGGGRSVLPRQQTLTALIDWSYDLLSEKERALLRRLAVFGRGRTLRAVEEVCSGDGVERWEILDLLQQLIDKSLVSAEHTDSGSARYFLLESVWDYARGKLAAAGETEQVCTRHLEYFVRVAEEAEPKLHGPEQAEWIEKLAAEHGNLRLALEWSSESSHAELGLRLASAIERYLEVRNYLTEGRDHFTTLLSHAADVRPEVRAKALASAGRIVFCQDDDATARELYTQAIALYRELGLEREAAHTRALLGFLEWSDGRLAASREHLEATAAFARQTGDRPLLALSLSGLGTIFNTEGDHAKARALKEESIATYQQTGDKWVIGLMTLSLTRVVIPQGDFAAARELLVEAAAIGEELGNEWSVPYVLEGFGNIAVGESDPARAARLYGAASVMRERLGLTPGPGELPAYDGAIAQMRAALAPASFDESWTEGRKLSPDEALDLARSL